MRLHLTASFLKLNIPTPFFMYLFFLLFILINFKFGKEKIVINTWPQKNGEANR